MLSGVAGFAYNYSVAHSAEHAHKALEEEVRVQQLSSESQGQALDAVRGPRASSGDALPLDRLETECQADLTTFDHSGAAALSSMNAEALGPVRGSDKAAAAPAGARAAADAEMRFLHKIANQTAARDDSENISARLAKWDEENLESDRLIERASVYLAMLTMFAVGLYLFGQAYGMGSGTGGKLLFVSGALLVGVAMITAFFPSKWVPHADVSDACGAVADADSGSPERRCPPTCTTSRRRRSLQTPAASRITEGGGTSPVHGRAAGRARLLRERSTPARFGRKATSRLLSQTAGFPRKRTCPG